MILSFHEHQVLKAEELLQMGWGLWHNFKVHYHYADGSTFNKMLVPVDIDPPRSRIWVGCIKRGSTSIEKNNQLPYFAKLRLKMTSP